MSSVDVNGRGLDFDAPTDSDESPTHVLDERVPAVAGPSRSKGVPHFTPAERAARGKAARAELRRVRTRRLGAGAEARGPDRSARGTGADASSGARPDPVRAHAGVPVRLLPRRLPSHGGRPRGRAPDGVARPALRRRASLELRHLRRAGPEARLQHQRLRRDAAGTLRVGRQAACREHRGRGPGPRLRRRGPSLGRDGGGARVPRGDGPLRGDGEHPRLVRAPRCRVDPRPARGTACRASR